MLTAVNENKEKIYAYEAKKKDEKGQKINYYCPECGCELILRQGSKNIWHFAHKNLQEQCMLRMYDNESLEHIAMKSIVKKIIERDNDCLISDLEHRVGSKIADYYFEVKDRFGGIKKIVVECVHKHTDIDVFRHKNEYYVEQGVYVIWIFNLDYFTYANNTFQEEVRINEIIKESHTMYYGKIYAIDIINELIYGIHLDSVLRQGEDHGFGYGPIDWSEYEDWKMGEGFGQDPQIYIDEHYLYHIENEYHLKRTKSPNPKLIKNFTINSFKRAWDNNALKYLPYRRNVANTYILKWW